MRCSQWVFPWTCLRNRTGPARGRFNWRINRIVADRLAYFTVIVNVSVLLHPLELVYVATYESVPTVNGILLIWREVEVYLLGPAQLHDPPLLGCGPRSTAVDGELTVALTVRANHFSAAAKQKIEAAGGTVEVV